MRIMGQGPGPSFTTIAIRISVIFSAEGLEFVLTPLGQAAASPPRSAPPKAAAEPFKIPRRFIRYGSGLFIYYCLQFENQLPTRLLLRPSWIVRGGAGHQLKLHLQVASDPARSWDSPQPQ